MSLHQSPFLSNGNYQTVVGFLRKHYAERIGSNSIPERMDSRIQKTVQHFMTEVAKVHGVNKPLQQLDQEVIRESTQSLDNWLRRSDEMQSQQSQQSYQFIKPPPQAAMMPQVIPKATTVSASAYARPRVPATPTGIPTSSVQPVIQPVAIIATQATQATQSTQLNQPQRTSLPDYDNVAALFGGEKDSVMASWPQPVEEEQEDPVLLMKKAQKQREAEMLSGKATSSMEITDMATASVDPTPQVQPQPVRTTPLPQDYIIPQESIVKYRETEYNIFLTSSDRDWFRNRTENRYNFSITFNPGNRTGYGYSPSVQERFRNIERIEFVKAIIPTESLTQIIRSTGLSGGIPAFNRDRIVNVLSLPFAGIRIAELNNNGFSTNPHEDNTFAIVQYDATWNSATAMNVAPGGTTLGAKTTVGYTALIPKFLKCQRVYEPTPLAGLQKLTLRMEQHDGSLLSNESDVFGIERICLSSFTSGIGTGTINYSGAANEYIFIETASYFASSAISEGDLIHLQGFVCAPTGSGAPMNTTLLDFQNFINNNSGLYVVAIGYVNSSGAIVEGVNDVGYANIIVVRSRFDNPTTGSTGRSASYFGGSLVEEGQLAQRINDQSSTANAAALINLSRQTHVVLRVITRDMDSASNIRPDNV